MKQLPEEEIKILLDEAKLVLRKICLAQRSGLQYGCFYRELDDFRSLLNRAQELIVEIIENEEDEVSDPP